MQRLLYWNLWLKSLKLEEIENRFLRSKVIITNLRCEINEDIFTVRSRYSGMRTYKYENRRRCITNWILQTAKGAVAEMSELDED